jgi:hypothetical protein
MRFGGLARAGLRVSTPPNAIWRTDIKKVVAGVRPGTKPKTFDDWVEK